MGEPLLEHKPAGSVATNCPAVETENMQVGIAAMHPASHPGTFGVIIRRVVRG
ncbi:MAG: hypothetical protein SVX38_06405 [Chloroflexota bacterium]|nr:hypothetical protein [Chloroflexota bacterium]